MTKDKSVMLTGRAVKVCLDIDRQVKNHMKGQASVHDVNVSKIWEEAAILWLRSKGVNIEAPKDGAEKQLPVNGQKA